MPALHYKLISVSKAEPLPAWLPKDNWYRYELAHHDSNMVGYYVGTLGTVTAYAEAVAIDLNERDINMKFSTVPLARYQPHSTRQKITLTNPAPQESPGKA